MPIWSNILDFCCHWFFSLVTCFVSEMDLWSQVSHQSRKSDWSGLFLPELLDFQSIFYWNNLSVSELDVFSNTKWPFTVFWVSRLHWFSSSLFSIPFSVLRKIIFCTIFQKFTESPQSRTNIFLPRFNENKVN